MMWVNIDGVGFYEGFVLLLDMIKPLREALDSMTLTLLPEGMQSEGVSPGSLYLGSCLKKITLDSQGRECLQFDLGFYLGPWQQAVHDAIQACIDELDPEASYRIELGQKVHAHSTQLANNHLSGVGNVIAVASGKGGVGKTTTAVNIALALQAFGAKVGLLDADVYGPNLPHMLGLREMPKLAQKAPMQPVRLHGLQTMSMAYLVAEEEALIWRGPMISRALTQMITMTAWQDLDYLILDLPPGTGDIPLTLAQKVPLAGAVVVTTPHEAAVADAQKAMMMFAKVRVPLLGFIENMREFVCDGCGKSHHLLGPSIAERLSQSFEIPCLGSMPMSLAHASCLVDGVPLMLRENDCKVERDNYLKIALNLSAALSLRPKSYSGLFSNVVVE